MPRLRTCWGGCGNAWQVRKTTRIRLLIRLHGLQCSAHAQTNADETRGLPEFRAWGVKRMRSLRGNYLSNLHFARLIIWSKVSAKSPDCQTTSALASKESLEFSENTERRGQKGNKHEGGGRGMHKYVCVCACTSIIQSHLSLLYCCTHIMYVHVYVYVYIDACVCALVFLCTSAYLRVCACVCAQVIE